MYSEHQFVSLAFFPSQFTYVSPSALKASLREHLFEKCHRMCKNCRYMFLCVLFSAFLANLLDVFSLHCYMTVYLIPCLKKNLHVLLSLFLKSVSLCSGALTINLSLQNGSIMLKLLQQRPKKLFRSQNLQLKW